MLLSRFERSGGLADVDAAVEAGQAAVAATPTDHPNQAMMLSNLGSALLLRFERSGALADVDAAVEALEAAVAGAPTDHPNQAMMLSHLGNALRMRFERSAAPTDLDRALSVYAAASESVSAAPSVRIRTARAAAELLAAQSQPGRAADLLDFAVQLLPEVAPRQLDRGDQQHALGGFAGLAADAAALALADTSRPGDERAARALRLLEAGRAVLLSQVLETRSDLTDLQHQYPDLAARFVELRDRLDQPADTSAPTTVPTGEVDPGAARRSHDGRDRRRLAGSIAATLAEIRDQHGFDSFGLPPTTDELVTEAASGPVVTFNVSGYRSDALLLTKNRITALPLAGITADSLIDKIMFFHQALHTATDPNASRTQRRVAQTGLSQILEWLWDTATEPVLHALSYRNQPPPGATWPRIWWAPGGLLGLLPVHAAGHHHDPASDPGRRTVIDRVISSYTPTVRALRHARQRTTTSVSANRALVVAMPTTPGIPGRLRNVPAEVAMLHTHLPQPVLLIEPDTPHSDRGAVLHHLPTKANVLGHLPLCPIAHFACHGDSDPTDPSKSLLLLHDHNSAPLTVASLAPVRLDQAQLAYLSACRTASIHVADLIDEAIHLTAAFQLAGFPHVVGTLWEIDDALAVTVAETFYTALHTDHNTIGASQAARALHHAVRTIRDKLPGTPSLWAAYLHAGA